MYDRGSFLCLDAVHFTVLKQFRIPLDIDQWRLEIMRHIADEFLTHTVVFLQLPLHRIETHCKLPDLIPAVAGGCDIIIEILLPYFIRRRPETAQRFCQTAAHHDDEYEAHQHRRHKEHEQDDMEFTEHQAAVLLDEQRMAFAAEYDWYTDGVAHIIHEMPHHEPVRHSGILSLVHTTGHYRAELRPFHGGPLKRDAGKVRLVSAV